MREKIMRVVKKDNFVIFDGSQIYHNYIRPHIGLDGKTSAQYCGIEIQGDNKWITLSQNASNTQ